MEVCSELVGSEHVMNCWNTSSLDALFFAASLVMLPDVLELASLLGRGLL